MTSDMSRFEQQQQTVQSGQFVPKSEPVDEVIDQNQNNTTVVSAASAGDTQIYRMSEDGSKLMGALKGTGGQEGQMVVETSYQGGDQIAAQSQPQNNAIAQAMAAAEQDTEAEAAGQQQLVIHADGQNEEQSQYVVATVTTTLHVCAICGKAYTQKDGLEEHMQSHASRLHSCSLCGAIFIDKSHLDVHMRQTHYPSGGGDTKMVVVEDDKSQLRGAQTQLVQGANGQILQVQVPANNNNNNTNTNNNMKPAGQQQVEVADGSEDQNAVAQQTGATAASATTTDHSIHRCPLCPYMSTSVNEFCKHVVLHAESKSDTPEQPPTSEAPVTIQPAAAGTVVAASGDKPQISIVPAAGNGTQTVTAQQFIASNGQPQYRCGICGEMINDSAVLQDHLRSHQENAATRLFSCSVCGVVYANKNQLETHMQTHIITPIPAQGAAPATTVAAAQVTQVATTQATVNGETRQVLIQTAGTTEWLKPTPSTTTTAVVGISGDAMSPSKPKERPYSCQICGKTFCQKAHLENHLRIHTGERPFACSMCGKAFRRKEHIGRHMRIHTGERPFHCTHCGKRFSQKVHLESHIRIHTGERPFSCSACGKTFTRKEHIERHIKTHTGERMFVCSQCGKSFNQKAHLESHMRTHTGERPYTCGPCGKTFRQRVQLERHARTHLAPGTEGILTTAGGQQVLTVAAVPGQQLTFIADPNIIQQLQSADGHTTITVPFCTLCGKALCQHMDAQQRQLIENAAAQGAQVHVVQAAPGQQLVQESGQLQVVDAGVIASADGAGDAVAQAVAQATGIEHDVSVQGMSVQEQVDKAISNAVA